MPGLTKVIVPDRLEATRLEERQLEMTRPCNRATKIDVHLPHI